VVDAAVTVDGRLFHALAAATRNAWSPSDDLLVNGSDGQELTKKFVTNSLTNLF